MSERFYLKNYNVCCEGHYLLNEELCNLLNSLDMQCESLQNDNEQLLKKIDRIISERDYYENLCVENGLI